MKLVAYGIEEDTGQPNCFFFLNALRVSGFKVYEFLNYIKIIGVYFLSHKEQNVRLLRPLVGTK